jgi:hypothetical protein
MGVHYLYEGNVMIINFASCTKDMTQVQNLTIVRKFNKGIARMVTSMN